MRIVSSLAAFVACSIANASPFDTVDQNPLLSGFDQPHPYSARLPSHATSFAATLNWSSTAVIQNGVGENLVVDAETREWRLSFERGLSDRFAFRIEIPYRTLDSDHLDKLIEDWHSTFGLPAGDRPALAHYPYRINYARGTRTLVRITQRETGFGDLVAAVGFQLADAQKSATSLWWNVKFPTGSSDRLTGSGALDSALSVVHQYELSHRWSTFAQLNGVYLGAGDFLHEMQRRFMWSGMFGADYFYSRALTLTVQLDAHTAAFKNSSLDLFGDAWIFTFGGDYLFNNGWRAQFGLSEDVKVSASPDVTFVISIGKSLGVSR